MTYTLTVSSQGQVVIPSQVRKAMGISKGAKIKLQLEKTGNVPTALIIPANIDWAKRVAGIAKGYYGNVDKYIERERASWDRSKSWP